MVHRVTTSVKQRKEKLMKKLIFILLIILCLFIAGCKKDEDNNEPTIEATIVGINTKTIMRDGVKETLYFIILEKDEVQYELEVNYKETFLGTSFENTYIIDTKLWFSNSEWQKAKPIDNN